ncbi:YceD family protein [Aquamicrobium segne]|uniref:YceD family protein n=1 Tax=Aquamicrobium segne TaxID=469547 RepID=A0ABW0H138_9HYPH
MNDADEKSPVSFEVHVARLPQKGLPVLIEADAVQKEALAKAHGLLAVEAYRAKLLVTPWNRNGVKISGQVVADVSQACVVTLDPIAAHINEAVEGLFLPAGSKLASFDRAGFGRASFDQNGEMLLDAEGPDSPEIFSGDTIDAGALTEEFFSLAIDPYPRKSGAVLDTSSLDGPEETEFQKKLRGLWGKT